MAIDLYWGSGSAYCWRVQLALEYKQLSYNSHLLKFDLQEHQAPQMLAMNPRGQLPVLRDGDYVVFESLAILYYLDRKYPDPPIFGRNPEEAGAIMRVICEYQGYAEPSLMKIVEALLYRHQPQIGEEVAAAMHRVAGEARTIERRLTQGDWVVGDRFSALDMVIYPDIRLLLRALARPEARELAARFLPLEVNYPALGRWLERVAGLPGHERTWPPHWKSAAA
jgi:glutathione S-transferase